jgi:plastocyanin
MPRFAQTLVSAVLLTGLLCGQGLWAGTIAGRVHGSNPSNTVIWVDDIEGSFPAPQRLAVMEQKALRFVPHVLAVQAGTTVEFPNHDPLSHNVFSISEPKRFNLGLYANGVTRRLIFDKPGVVELLCNVHLEMSGYIVVVKNPFFASPDVNGTYRISDVPAGRHRLRYWREDAGAAERSVDVPSTSSVTVDF